MNSLSNLKKVSGKSLCCLMTVIFSNTMNAQWNFQSDYLSISINSKGYITSLKNITKQPAVNFANAAKLSPVLFLNFYLLQQLTMAIVLHTISQQYFALYFHPCLFINWSTMVLLLSPSKQLLKKSCERKPGLWKYSYDCLPKEPIGSVNLYNDMWNIDYPSPKHLPSHPCLKQRCLFFPTPMEIKDPCFVWEQEGISSDLKIYPPKEMHAKYATLVNLRGEKTGKKILARNNTITVSLKTYEPVSFVLER